MNLNAFYRISSVIAAFMLLFTTANARHIHLEKTYQRVFCAKVRGKLEYRLRDRTRVDCLTSNYAFEVDFGRKAFEAVGQTLYYALMTHKKPSIVLIQETKQDNRYIGRIKKLAKRYGIVLFVINRYFEIRKIK